MDAITDHDSALVFGIGGSGDVVGAVPTARLLERHGVSTTLGGVAWRPAPADPHVGPRPMAEIENVEPLGDGAGADGEAAADGEAVADADTDGHAAVADTVAYATGETRTTDGVAFAESRVAAYYDEPVVLLDVTEGVDGVVAGLEAACEAEGFDLVVGTDSGGDVLAAGDEPGLRSPVTDGLGLVALTELSVDTALGVFGWGSDGELTAAELADGFERAARRDGYLGAWGLAPPVVAEMEGLLADVATEASRLPVEAARGALGPRTIRGGDVDVELTPASTATFYFDPDAVADTSGVAEVVREERTLEAVRAALRERGLTTEFEREAARLAEWESGSGGVGDSG